MAPGNPGVVRDREQVQPVTRQPSPRLSSSARAAEHCQPRSDVLAHHAVPSSPPWVLSLSQLTGHGPTAMPGQQRTVRPCPAMRRIERYSI
jgi:hypothetical protein